MKSIQTTGKLCSSTEVVLLFGNEIFLTPTVRKLRFRHQCTYKYHVTSVLNVSRMATFEYRVFPPLTTIRTQIRLSHQLSFYKGLYCTKSYLREISYFPKHTYSILKKLRIKRFQTPVHQLPAPTMKGARESH